MKRLIAVLLLTLVGSASATTLGRVSFDTDKDSLTPVATTILSQNLLVLQKTNSLVLIDGHCDNRGTSEYNLSLGQRRATAVRKFYLAHGIPAARLVTVSFGKEDGQGDETTVLGLSLNRTAGTRLQDDVAVFTQF